MKTNLQNKGLISADRGTRPLSCVQYLRSLFKSYTKDLSLPIFELVFQHRLQPLYWQPVPLQCYDLGPKAILTHVTSGRATYRRFPAWILA